MPADYSGLAVLARMTAEVRIENQDDADDSAIDCGEDCTPEARQIFESGSVPRRSSKDQQICHGNRGLPEI